MGDKLSPEVEAVLAEAELITREAWSQQVVEEHRMITEAIVADFELFARNLIALTDTSEPEQPTTDNLEIAREAAAEHAGIDIFAQKSEFALRDF